MGRRPDDEEDAVKKRYLVETFGCQMNVHDSERMAGLLEQAGYEAREDALDADVVVVNTCSVREHAEAKLYTRLGEIRVMGEETGRRPVVVVAGCVAQQEGDALLAKTNGRLDRRRPRHASGSSNCRRSWRRPASRRPPGRGRRAVRRRHVPGRRGPAR